MGWLCKGVSWSGWQAQRHGNWQGKCTLIVQVTGLGLYMIIWRTVHILPGTLKMKDLSEQNIIEYAELCWLYSKK